VGFQHQALCRPALLWAGVGHGTAGRFSFRNQRQNVGDEGKKAGIGRVVAWQNDDRENDAIRGRDCRETAGQPRQIGPGGLAGGRLNAKFTGLHPGFGIGEPAAAEHRVGDVG